MRALGAACALWALLTAGCTVDTETGVGATVQATTLSITGVGLDARIDLRMTVEFHVGEHVMEARTFNPSPVDLFAGEQPIGRVYFERPAGFDFVLAPGETEVVELHANDLVGGPNSRDLACADGAVVRIVLRWMDTTSGDLRMTEVTTDDVTCD